MSYVQFTKRTNQPKLGWLLALCKLDNLRVKKAKYDSWHAPITMIHEEDEESGLELLSLVDEIADHDQIFRQRPTKRTLLICTKAYNLGADKEHSPAADAFYRALIDDTRGENPLLGGKSYNEFHNLTDEQVLANLERNAKLEVGR